MTGRDIMPPRVPQAILRRILPPPIAEAVTGDLDEQFRQDSRTRGVLGAILRYWREVFTWDTVRLVREMHRSHSPHGRGASPSRPTPFSGSFWRGLRQAVRSLRRQPSFSLTVIALVAVGIGATTTIFSVVDGVLFRQLPYDNAAELVFLDKAGHGAAPIPDYRDWVASSSSFGSLAASTDERITVTQDGEPTSLQGSAVTANFFPTLGVRAHRGRLFVEDDYDGSRSVAVLSHGLWQRRWGGDPGVIGRTLTLNGQPATVVGILPADFVPIDVLWQSGSEIWMPVDLDNPDWASRTTWILAVLGRLAPGATVASAQAEMEALAERLADAYPETNRQSDGSPMEITVTSLHEATVGDVGPTLLMLFGAVGLLLLLTSANVANLFLARGADRKQEMAVRSALGAKRGRLVGQLVTEGLLLATTGGLLGLLLAEYGVGAFRTLNPGNVPRLDAVAVDWRVAAFAVVLSLGTGIVFAVLPALRSTRVDLSDALKDGSRSGTAGRRLLGATNMVVAGEIAIALMLLVGAGLLLNSFVRLVNVDPGIDPRGAYAIDLRLGAEYGKRASKVAFTRDLLERLETMPGVHAAGASHRVPMGGGVTWRPRVRDANAPGDDEGVTVMIRTVTPGFFESLGIPLLAGRAFTWQDNREGEDVAIISLSFAERLWPGQDPMGKRVMEADDPDMGPATIVGVVGDVKYQSLVEAPMNLFVPYARYAWYRGLSVAIRSDGDAGAVAHAVKEAVWAADLDIPVTATLAMTDRVAETVVTPKFYSTMLTAFAGIALLLAAGGIYGTMLYSVGQRRKEFGIRLAVGAKPSQILGLILTRGLGLTVIGMTVGLAGAVVLSRVLDSLVFDISTTDIPTYGGVVLALVAVSMAACYLPGRRAAATDPVVTLNSD
jgi:putative ABC transport system permease protein